ncbi:MAG: DUF6314 family protein [Pseudomonadota bacterium]
MESATKSVAPCRPPIADWLLGRWQLNRVIHDLREGRVGIVTGTLEVTTVGPCDDVLSVEERGEMVLGGRRFPISRRVLWRVTGAAAFDVRFGDGRPFHALRFEDGVATARHDCGADRYDVVYRLGSVAWFSLWRVAGPAKDQWILTQHSRDGAGPPR